MAKEDLETKAHKATLRIDKNTADGVNVLRDLSMKICYLIKKDKGNGYRSEGNNYD